MEKLDEKTMRISPNLAGEKIPLGDGQEWIISPMPLDDSLEETLTLMERYSDLEVEMLYPATVEDPESKESLEENKEPDINQRIQGGMKKHVRATKDYILHSREIAFHILKLNYPELTKELFNKHRLANLENVKDIVNIFSGKSTKSKEPEEEQKKKVNLNDA